MAEFRVEFTIARRDEGEEDFTEIGFGSSCACGSIDQAAYDAQSIIDNRQWETEPGQPSPCEAITEALTGKADR